jgi:hypothetical protein
MTDSDGASSQDEEEYTPTPWHFKLLLIALVLYLTYRLVQLILWLAHVI